jgi:hypothetical protein
MKYICKQKLPFCDVGQEVEIDYPTKTIHPVISFKTGTGLSTFTVINDWVWGKETLKDWFEPKRWRAEEGEMYWLVDTDGTIVETQCASGYYEKARYECGNYFKSHVEASKARQLVLEALKKAHE